MLSIDTCDKLILATTLKNQLEMAEIDCFINNENLIDAIGELPSIACWPEIYIINHAFASDANNIIQQGLNVPQAMPECYCPSEEPLETQFKECWNCGHENI